MNKLRIANIPFSYKMETIGGKNIYRLTVSKYVIKAKSLLKGICND